MLKQLKKTADSYDEEISKCVKKKIGPKEAYPLNL